MRPLVATLGYADWRLETQPSRPRDVLILCSPRQFSFFKSHEVLDASSERDLTHSALHTYVTHVSPASCIPSAVPPLQAGGSEHGLCRPLVVTNRADGDYAAVLEELGS